MYTFINIYNYRGFKTNNDFLDDKFVLKYQDKYMKIEDLPNISYMKDDKYKNNYIMNIYCSYPDHNNKYRCYCKIKNSTHSISINTVYSLSMDIYTYYTYINIVNDRTESMHFIFRMYLYVFNEIINNNLKYEFFNKNIVMLYNKIKELYKCIDYKTYPELSDDTIRYSKLGDYFDKYEMYEKAICCYDKIKDENQLYMDKYNNIVLKQSSTLKYKIKKLFS
jgi:hypothetical protein